MHPLSLTAVILAGGRGSRLDSRDKPLVELAGRPLIEHILDAVRPRVDQVMISANRNLERYAAYGVPVFADDLAGFQGPLAGMHAALGRCATPYALFLPGDAPLVDALYIARMRGALAETGAAACVAEASGRLQPVHCLLARALHASIAQAAARQASVIGWLEDVGAIAVDCSDMPRHFMNLNTADDLRALAAALGDTRTENPDDR